MGKKIFISYKYSDSDVLPLEDTYFTTARDYVDKIAELLEEGDHIYKGEDDGEDLSSLLDSTIGSKLGDKIFDSSITLVLISKGMKDIVLSEKNQWIPWEVSYSLKVQSRDGQRSKTSAVLAIVLPDRDGNYNYFLEENTCPHCNCRTLKTDFLFQILRENMFNIKKPEYAECNNHIGNIPHKGYSSYIHSVKWEDFLNDHNKYINIALEIRECINNYELTKTVK